MTQDKQQRKKNLLTSMDTMSLDSLSPETLIPDTDSKDVIEGFRIHRDRPLGRGTWSEVFVATHLISGTEVAAKVVPKAKLKPHEAHFVHTEAALLAQINHPNVVHLYQMAEDALNYYLFLELVQGADLFSYLEKNRKMTERMARKVFAQVVDAMSRLQQLGIVHRDLKLENIIISPPINGVEDNRKVTLLDFGLAAQMHSTDQKLSEWCGSPLYASIELISKIPYRYEVDVWALGVILYCMVAGYQPFYGKTVAEIFQKIRSQPLQFPEHFSAPLRELITRMLYRDAARRITINEIRRHAWLRTRQQQQQQQQSTSSSTTQQQVAVDMATGADGTVSYTSRVPTRPAAFSLRASA